MDWIGLEYIYKSIANVIAILTSRKRDLVCILGYRPPNLLHRFQLHEILGGSSTNGNNKKEITTWFHCSHVWHLIMTFGISLFARKTILLYFG